MTSNYMSDARPVEAGGTYLCPFCVLKAACHALLISLICFVNEMTKDNTFIVCYVKKT